MQSKRIGKQSIQFPSKPYLVSGAAIVGKKEGEGPLGDCFDRIVEDELNGQKTFELGEKQFYLDAIDACLEKAGVGVDQVQFLLGGDLLNQIISASFSARELSIPFLGLYGACATMSESLCLASMLVDGGYASHAVCAASSHFCTAERQYRFPLEFAAQRPSTSQWTVTGAGATLISHTPSRWPLARATGACIGRVVDLGVTDANNMGAAMAPAAADTLLALLKDTDTRPEDYDLILTGDLGQVGHDLFIRLVEEQGFQLGEGRYSDCGMKIFDAKLQDVHAGGSGCGCSAAVLNGYYLPLIQKGKYQKVIFMATGALLSSTSCLQGQSVPGIAHAILLEAPERDGQS